MKKVLKDIEQLDEAEQKRLAALLQHELLWQASFEKSHDVLGKLADEALTDYKNGRTTKGDW